MRRSVLFVGYGDKLAHFLRPYGYQRVIHGSVASLVLKGHRAAYLELAWNSLGPIDTKLSLLAEGKKVEVSLIRASFRRFGRFASRGGLFFYADSARTRLDAELIEKIEELGPEYVISEARIPWFTAKDVAKMMGAKLLLRPHKVESMDLPGRVHEGVMTSIWTAIMFLYTVPLSYASDWVLSLAKPDEQVLRRFLVSRITTVEPTYASLLHGAAQERVEELIEEIRPFIVAYRPDWLHIHLARVISDVSFVLLGVSQDELPEVVGLPREKIPSNVVAVGHVSGTALAKLLKHAMILLIPQKYISDSCLRLIEGLSYGLPMVVTTDVASKVEGLVNGVHLIVEDDFSKWASILKRLVADEEFRERLRENASRFYHERLRPLIHARRLEAVFERLEG